MTIEKLKDQHVDIDALLADESTPEAHKRSLLLDEEQRLRAIASNGRLRLGSGEAARLSKVLLALESLRRGG